MLVLSRKPGERIVVPQCGLAVTIIAVHGKAVRLGIDAPTEVAILRDELVRQKKRGNPSSKPIPEEPEPCS